LEEGLNLGRKSSLTIAGLIVTFGSIFTAYFTENLQALDTMDFWICNVFIFIMAGVQIVIFGWVLGIDKGMEELQYGSQIRLPYCFRFIMKYVSPLYLLIVFVAWVSMQFTQQITKIAENHVVQLALGFIVFVTIFNLFVTSQALTQWKKRDKLESDEVDGEL
jgi:hypothetical protein